MADNQPVRQLLCLMVTDEQKTILEGIFNFHNWDLQRATLDDHNLENQREHESDNSASNHTGSSSYSSEHNIQDGASLDSENNISENECCFCLCDPCITAEMNRQLWWPVQNLEPSVRNRSTRNKTYKKFWAMMTNKNKWSDPRYMDRKLDALGQDPSRKHYTWHKREIMPNCILKLVREWFPKTLSEEYIGHLWGED